MKALARLLLCLCLGAAPVAAAPAATADDALVDRIAAQLARPDTLRGRFRQEKQLAGFRNPLRSEGDFLLVRGQGVAWNTTSPFPSSMLLTRRGMATVAADGSRRVVVDATQSPAGAAVMSLMLALIGGDLETLRADFAIGPVAAPGDDGRWRMTLVPREPALRQAIAGIELSGDGHIDGVRVSEAGGDVTTIAFAELADAPAASAQERARLD